MKIAMGQRVKDAITGFSGVVTGRAEYLTGCTQYLLTPSVNERGEYVENRWFDEDRLEPMSASIVKLPLTMAGPDKPAPRKS